MTSFSIIFIFSYVSYHIYIYHLPFRISRKFQRLISGPCLAIESILYNRKIIYFRQRIYYRKTRPTEGFPPSFCYENFQTYSKVDNILCKYPNTNHMDSEFHTTCFVTYLSVTFMIHFKNKFTSVHFPLILQHAYQFNIV